MSYSKLHSSLVNSSLWTESDSVRLLFITLLAMCDRQGFVYGSRPGIARLANIEPETEDDPWEVLSSPDPHSSDRLRNPENEGRRIEEVPGGFRLLNFDYYRGLRNDDERREQTRQAVARHRQAHKPMKASVSQGKPVKASESQCKQIPSASASVSVSESKEEKKKPLSEEETVGYCVSRGLPEADGKWLWAKWQGNGFTNGGKPMKSWKQTIIQWQLKGGIFPSQTYRTNGTHSKHSTESGRGLGTANEGKSSQYAGVGKV